MRRKKERLGKDIDIYIYRWKKDEKKDKDILRGGEGRKEKG